VIARDRVIAVIGKQTLPLIDTDDTDQELPKMPKLPKIAEIEKQNLTADER
jgi:hypothetical protein